MIIGLPHDEAGNALEALALDALDTSERTAVISHVDGCSVCRFELTALENTAAQLTYVMRPVPVSDAARDRVKGRLMHRVADRSSVTPRRSDEVIARTLNHRPSSGLDESLETASPLHILVPHPDTAPVPYQPVRVSARGAWWLAAAATLVAAGSLLSLYKVNEERVAATTSLQAMSVDNSQRRQVFDSLRSGLADRDRMIANLTGRDVTVVTLASAESNAPSARMFWNQSVNAWIFVAHNVPTPAAGRTYQVWLVTAKEKISVGTFMPGANGDASLRATYVLPKDALAAVAVTDEPQAGSAQPTTTPMMMGLASAR